MKYCKECGSKLDEQHNFCTDCGAIQSSNANQEAPQNYQEPVRQRVNQPRRNPMKKSTKVIIGTSIALVVIIFGVHKGLSSYFDPMKDLQAMDEAVASGSVSEFVEYIEFDDNAILNQEEYFQYIRNVEWDSVKSQYTGMLEEENSLTSKINSVNSNPLYTVQPNEHLFGLYTTYSLRAEPIKLTAHTSMDNTELTINDLSEAINVDTPKEITLYPGTYTVSGSASNMFGEFTYENSVEIHEQSSEEIELDFSGNTYPFSTNKHDATLFVNGEDTGLKLGEIDSLGPLPEDSNVKMHAEWTNPNGDTFKTETVTKEDTSWYGGIPLSFDETEIEETQESKVASIETEDLGETVLSFRDAYEKALNSKDFSLIKDFMKKDSDADKGLKEYIRDLKDTDYNYEFTSNKVLDVEEIDDKTVKVTTNEKFIFTNHKDEQTDYDREKTYTMKLVDEEYKISKIDYVETNRDNQ